MLVDRILDFDGGKCYECDKDDTKYGLYIENKRILAPLVKAHTVLCRSCAKDLYNEMERNMIL